MVTVLLLPCHGEPRVRSEGAGRDQARDTCDPQSGRPLRHRARPCRPHPGRPSVHPPLRLRCPGVEGASVREVARVRPRGHHPLLRSSAPRGRDAQVESAEAHCPVKRLALPQGTEEGAEGVEATCRQADQVIDIMSGWLRCGPEGPQRLPAVPASLGGRGNRTQRLPSRHWPSFRDVDHEAQPIRYSSSHNPSTRWSGEALDRARACNGTSAPDALAWTREAMNSKEEAATMDAERLLAKINRELETISQTQHRLARQKALLQEHATRLRLGASPIAVRVALHEAAALEPGDLRSSEMVWEPSSHHLEEAHA